MWIRQENLTLNYGSPLTVVSDNQIFTPFLRKRRPTKGTLSQRGDAGQELRPYADRVGRVHREAGTDRQSKLPWDSDSLARRWFNFNKDNWTHFEGKLMLVCDWPDNRQFWEDLGDKDEGAGEQWHHHQTRNLKQKLIGGIKRVCWCGRFRHFKKWVKLTCSYGRAMSEKAPSALIGGL